MDNKVIAVCMCGLGLVAAPFGAEADIMWDWSFSDESGTFTSDGNLTGGSAAAGTYTLTDFSLTTSVFGAPVGSLIGGQYLPVGVRTGPGPFNLPFSFDWSGSAVTTWTTTDSSVPQPLPGTPWGFIASGSTVIIGFGYYDPSGRDPMTAEAFNLAGKTVEGALTLNVAQVPEPGALGLLVAGLAGITLSRRNRNRSVLTPQH